MVYAFGGLAVAAAGAYALVGPSQGRTEISSSSPYDSYVTTTQTGKVGVRVVYFGMPLTVTGTKKETVSLASPAHLSDLENAIAKMHPELVSMLPTMLILVDGMTTTGNPQLEENDEVDILASGVGG